MGHVCNHVYPQRRDFWQNGENLWPMRVFVGHSPSKMRPISILETSGTNHSETRCHIPEKRYLQLECTHSWKYRTSSPSTEANFAATRLCDEDTVLAVKLWRTFRLRTLLRNTGGWKSRWTLEASNVKWLCASYMYEGWNFNSGNYLFTTATK